MASGRICLQWSMIVYTTITVILGILGILATVYQMEVYSDGFSDNTDRIIQIVISSCLIVFSIIGCCVIASGSSKGTGFYIFLLVALMVSHGWKLWRYDESKNLAQSETTVTSNWIEELVKSGSMSEMQQKYKCCGKRAHTDYGSLNLKIPKSCYRSNETSGPTYPFNEGCMSAVKRTYLEMYRWEKWTHVGLLGYEALGVLLSIILICSLSSKTRRYNY